MAVGLATMLVVLVVRPRACMLMMMRLLLLLLLLTLRLLLFLLFRIVFLRLLHLPGLGPGHPRSVRAALQQRHQRPPQRLRAPRVACLEREQSKPRIE